jgi:hypothetical protein
MYRSPVFNRYGGFYSKDKCRFSEDRYLWLQVVLNHSIFVLMKSLFWYHRKLRSTRLPCTVARGSYRLRLTDLIEFAELSTPVCPILRRPGHVALGL